MKVFLFTVAALLTLANLSTAARAFATNPAVVAKIPFDFTVGHDQLPSGTGQFAAPRAWKHRMPVIPGRVYQWCDAACRRSKRLTHGYYFPAIGPPTVDDPVPLHPVAP